MLVIIPTFKRLESLKWVIISLLNSRLPLLDSKPRLVVLNNYPPNSYAVEELVKKIFNEHSKSEDWQLLFKHRQQTLIPVINWYSAINEFAMSEEIVFLHGDDDLFFKNDLKERYEIIVQNKADILVSEFHGGITFIDENKFHTKNYDELISYKEKPIINKEKFVSSPFISAQVLKKSSYFDRAFQLCNNWIIEQNWADFKQTSLMLPFYLPIAIEFLGGKVISTQKKYVLRGTSLLDRTNSPYGVPTWNSGYVALFTQGVLSNSDLSKIDDLDKARISNMYFVNTWFYTFFFDKRIDKSELKQTLKKIKINKNWRARLLSVKMLVADSFRLTAFRVRLQIMLKRNIYPISKLVNEI